MYHNRFQQLQTVMIQKRLSALFVTSPQNVTYLSGFRGLCSTDVLVPCLTDPEIMLLITPQKLYVVTDKRCALPHKPFLSRSAKKWFSEITIEKNIFQTIGKLCRRFAIRKIGIEKEALRASDLTALKKKIKGVAFRDASPIIPELRRVKDTQEIAALTKACHVTDRAFSALLRFVHVGMTEGAIAHFLVDFFYHHADGPAFAPIVASGKGAAIPHYCTSKTKKIRRGEMLLLDFGARVNGYHADMSRTIFLGKATPRFKKIYYLVREAQEKTINGLHVGMSGKVADAIARIYLTRAGFKKEFAHGSGHGVGLQIHEAPRLSPRAKDTLEIGNVFTVEPGLYFPSWGGVRIEDTVLLTSKDPRLLTRSSKELIEIGAS